MPIFSLQKISTELGPWFGLVFNIWCPCVTEFDIQNRADQSLRSVYEDNQSVNQNKYNPRKSHPTPRRAERFIKIKSQNTLKRDYILYSRPKDGQSIRSCSS